MQDIINKIINKKEFKKIDESCVEIITNAEIENGTNIRIFIKQLNNRVILTDEKNTLRFMNTKYELKAADVKHCINDVVRHYGFVIDKGEILTELKSTDDTLKRYNDLLICSATLANMFIFFDTPVED